MSKLSSGSVQYWPRARGLGAIECLDPSLTQQSQREDADINVIVKRFGVTGQLPQMVQRPQLEMFVDVFDYQSAMNAIVAADRSFMAMPAEVRSRFDNDAGAFVNFCEDPENLPQLRLWGLAPPPEKAPETVSEVDEAKPKVEG